MREIQTQQVTTTVEILQQIICNQCGQPCSIVGTVETDNEFHQYNAPDCFEHAAITAVWSFDSQKAGQAHQAHLCEKCYDALIATFAIPPTIDDPMDHLIR